MSAPAITEEPRAQNQVEPVSLVDGFVFQRYEYKYVIPPAMAGPISEFLRPYCEVDCYAAKEPGGFYTITSLYLDTRGMKTYWDKEGEVPDRFKMRVRTYGWQADGPVKFEIKRRFNDVSRKTWVQVPRDIWPVLPLLPDGADAAGVPGAHRAALDDFLNLTRRLEASPKMLVRYERRAFVSRIDRYVRVSFDRRIVCQPCTTYDLQGDPRRWQPCDGAGGTGDNGPRMILELKFMTSAPVWLVDMVRTFELFRRGYSKYGSAVRRSMGPIASGAGLSDAVPALRLARRG